METWIASDGRAYVVYLNESEEPLEEPNTSDPDLPEHDFGMQVPQSHLADGQHSAWMGTCIHDFEIPRWVQKQKRVDPREDKPVYFEPKRAVQLAVNAKFSLIAVGLLR